MEYPVWSVRRHSYSFSFSQRLGAGGWIGRISFFFFSAPTIQRIIIVITSSILTIINIVIVIIIIVVVRSLSLFLLLNVHLSTFHMFLHDEGFLMRKYYLTLS